MASGSPTYPSRCTQCDPRQMQNSRNLVVCIDGTSNQFGRNNTNVVKLFAKVDLETTHPNPKQYAYYSSGIGTRPQSMDIRKRITRAFSDNLNMAVAWNMDEIVKDAYGWLAQMYQEGDQIYFFGFSRGAYQVRVLTGMIHEVGLIRTPTEKQIGMAYDYYAGIRSANPNTRQIAKEFKDTFSWKDTRVHFVGVWDTVSSVGLTRGDPFLSTSMFAAHACHFRHALALDELRVKFMPEYFREMNSQTGDQKFTTASTPKERRLPSTSTASDNVINECTTTELKEVWFAGSHSDVGGQSGRGQSHQAGNVPLLWMRREAAASGLVLRPTDIIWVPDDVDFGINNSMSFRCGSGRDAMRLHLSQPRRIIPGQKVHASILFANAYKPQASLGEGFDLAIQLVGLDTKLDDQTWETGLFDDTAAQKLLEHLGDKQKVAPICLDRLLFMLRFEEGKRCIRNIPDWQNQLLSLIRNHDYLPLVRLVALVAYYEASFNPEAHSTSLAPPINNISQDILNDMKKILGVILMAHKFRNSPRISRVIALLRPLTNHKILLEQILTPNVQSFVTIVDVLTRHTDENFGQAMRCLNSLLQCEGTQKTIIEMLGEKYPGSNRNVSRLSRILEVNVPHLLTAALYMVLTLARISEAKPVCSGVKHKIRELARKQERRVGLLAVEILLVLYDPAEPEKLNIEDVHVRANLANVLIRLNPDRHDSANSVQQILRQIFGLDASRLSDIQKRLIGELKLAVQKGDCRERTAATMTLLKLFESESNFYEPITRAHRSLAEVIRTHLLQINLLDVFINQLRSKDSALLAAYALANCLNYSDVKNSVKNNELLPKNVVSMLRFDYFDDAFGKFEGFQIFGDLMQHADLRERIKKYNITHVLRVKLATGKSKETRTGLICLDIFQSFDRDGPWTKELVDESLWYLRRQEWKAQKAGVMILSALAQTENAVEAIGSRIHDIIEMLLPEHYLPPTAGACSTSPNESQILPAATTTEFAIDASPRPPSWMMGPACALRILAQNKVLRDRTRKMKQYRTLKDLFLSGILFDETDTPWWRMRTPNQTDIIYMLDNVINAVDDESEESLMLIGDTVLPRIRHWNPLVTVLRDGRLFKRPGPRHDQDNWLRGHDAQVDLNEHEKKTERDAREGQGDPSGQ